MGEKHFIGRIPKMLGKNMLTDEYYSELDSDRFRLKVAKINDFGSDPTKILDEFASSDYNLLLCKIDSKNIGLINKLEDFGFRIKDGQVTYKYEMSRFDKKLLEYLEDPSVELRFHKKKDIDQIVKLTEASFNNYGHYAADERLDKNKCRDVYTDWAYRSCTDKGVADKVFVAEIDGIVAGYLAFKVYKSANYTYAASVLGAVSEKFRREEIFRKITVKALVWCLEENFSWQEHSVLIDNYPVNRSFSKLGFVPYKSFYTLHCWL